MSAETSGEVSNIQDEDVLRKMWQDTEDFGRKKEIRSHMYKLREERLRNFYSSSDAGTEIQRAQSTPGLHDKPSKEGNGPTHADSLADHSFLSLKSKEIRDSESPTREMHYKVTDKNRGGDQGWNVVSKNETSSDGKTHTTSRLATTSGTDKIDGGVANYAAKCEQKASVFNDGNADNFTKAVSASSNSVIQQEAKGGDDHSNFQSFATSSSSSSKTVTQHKSTSGDTTNLKALPSNVDDSSSTTVIRKTYTTDVPEELRRSPNYTDGNTKVFTETRTLPDGTQVTTTRYETRGGKTVTSSSADNYSTSSKQVLSEQKSSTVKSSSSKTETHSSNKTSQEGRNTFDDVNRTRIVNQTGDSQIVRHIPDNFDNDQRTISVKVVRSSNDDVDQSNITQNVSKTSSSTVNIQKSHNVVDSRNVDMNIKSDRVIQTKDIIHDTKRDSVKQSHDTERNVNVRQEHITTKNNVIKTQTQDVHGTNQDDVRIIRLIQENEYLPRDKQPSIEQLPKDHQTSSTTTSKQVVTTKGDTTKTQIIKNVHDTVQGDVRITKVIQDSDYTPRDRQPELESTPKDKHPNVTRQEVVTTTKEVITKTSENIPKFNQKDMPQQSRIPIEYKPGDRTPAASTPGDRTPSLSTPGDQTPVARTPGNRTPAMQEIVCHLVPHQERPDQHTPKAQHADVKDSYTIKTTTTVTTHVDNKTGDKKIATDDFINTERSPIKDSKPQRKEESPKYETPERREPIKPGKSELDQKPVPTDGQYQTTYRTDYVNKRISVDISPTHDAFARSLRAVSPDRDKKRGSTRSLKSSTSSLRSSTSPEKYPLDRRQPGRVSPDRKPMYDSRGSSPTKRPSPDKFISTETITKTTSPTRPVCSPMRSPTKQTPNETINTDTITRRRKNDTQITSTNTVTRTSPDKKPVKPSTDDFGTTTRTTRVTNDDNRRSVVRTTDTNETIDTSTLTRRPKERPRSRSVSPTSIASDIEFVRNNEIVTDLDVDDSVTTTTTTRKSDTAKVNIHSNIVQTQSTEIDENLKDKRPTSLNVTPKTPKKITDRSPTSPLTDYSPPTRKSPTKEKPQDKPLKRRDTYEERCRQILGIPNKTTVDKTVTEIKKTTTTPVDDQTRSTPRKSRDEYPKRPSKSPEKLRSPTKDVQEFPSQIRRSPAKQPLEKVPAKTRPTKDASKILKFPSQIRRSPAKEPLQKPPEKRRPSKDKPKVQEFPSQIRRSPEKQPLEQLPGKARTPSYQSKIQEFPSQIRRSPEKQPLEKYPEKVRPTKDRPSVAEYPSQVKTIPVVGRAPGAVDEPVFTKKFISTLCRDDELQRTDVRRTSEEYPSNRRSPERTSGIPLLREHKQPSPERKPPSINKYFIDTERTDADITISQYGEKPRITSPDRRSPDRKTETYDIDRRTTTKDVTEYTDEYTTPSTDGRRPLKPERKSPVRFLDSETTTRTNTTDVTEYTDEYETPYTDRRRPTKPDRSSPVRSTLDSESTRRTKITDNTEYTDEYRTKIPLDEDKTKPRDRRPERESPERIRGVTEYTDEYCATDKRERTTADHVTKTTTRQPSRSTKPGEDEETTDSETEITTRVTKEMVTTINGDVPKRTSPFKPGTKTENKPKSGITEYPSQKHKSTKPTTKVTKTTSTTRKDKKDDKITLYDIDTMHDTEVDDKVHIRTHRIDDYYTTSKTTRPLTNGEPPKSKIGPKRFEPKLTKPSVAEYPSQKTPDRRKPVSDKPSKPVKELPAQRRPVDQAGERKSPRKSEPPRTSYYSPRDKPQSPERYSPSRQFTDNQRISTIQTVTRKTATKTALETSDTKARTKTPTKTIQRQPGTQPKRHIVTTTIQVIPKTRPEGPRKLVGKTTVYSTTVKSTKLTQPKTVPKTRPRKPLQNGRATTEDSETDEEVVDEIIDTKRVTQDTSKITRRTDAKITRTISDQVIKTPYRTPVRGQSKPELLPSKTTRVTDSDKTTRKTDRKVITTKSIIINNDFDTDREIVVNLQRSKSSREPTPDRIYPYPATEDEDTGIPRYPDQITEPDELNSRRKPTRLTDIPIIESQGTAKFTRTTDYEDHKKTTKRVDKVEDKDECLLSVNQKVSKFVDVAENLAKPKASSPTRKPNIIVDEIRQKDETYSSVTNKMTKSINTAEQLTTQQYIPERPRSPKCKNYPDVDQDDEAFTSVSEKVSHFIETAEKIKSPQKPSIKSGPAPRVRRPDFTDVDETIKTDDCLLSVSDKVTKFSQKLKSPDYRKPVSLAKIDITPTRESPTREIPRRDSSTRDSPARDSPRRESPRRESPRRESPRREVPQYGSPKRYSPSRITTECVQIDTEDQTYTRRLSPERYSPARRGSSPRPYSSDKTPTKSLDRPSTLTKTEIQENRYTRKDSSIKEFDSTPKSSRKDDEPKSVLSPTGRLRSTESIRRAKELFENMAKEQKTTKQRDILSRPSVFEGRKIKKTDDKLATRITTSEDVKLTDIGVYNLRNTDNRTKNICTKLRYDSDEDLELTDTRRKTTTSSYNKDDNLKSTRLILDKLNRQHSPERDDTDAPGYLRPLDRSPRPHSPYYGRSRSPKSHSKSPSRDRSPRPHDPSLDEIPHYMWPLDRTLHDHDDHERSHSPRSREPTPDMHGKIRSRESSPDRNVPGYMKPLDRQVHSKSPHRKNEPEESISKRHSVDDTDRTTKFGVNLRRGDSGKSVTTTTTSTTSTSQRRKFSAIEIERILTTNKFEEMYDLEILEVLLERAINYEQRRRIRSQIRIVKQLIAENKLTTIVTKKTSKTSSPTREAPKSRGSSPDKPLRTDRRPSDKSHTEYQTEYIRKVSPTRKSVENKLQQHTDIISKRSDINRKTEYQSSYAYSERRTSSEVKMQVRGSSPETKVIRRSPEKAPRKSVEKIVRLSPERKTQKTETRSVFKTELKRTTPVTKTVVEEKPSWVTQRPLKKVTDGVSTRKTSSTTTTTATATKKQISSRTSPAKDRKPIDDITSSYGVGPTDENGSPLFGLKALRAQNRTDTAKVQGTVIRSHYYSENGHDPTGEISVTKYSTDPRDLDGNVEERNGLVSVTTTQKFGTKGTPSYKTVIDKKKITDLDDEERETVTRKTSSTKVSRRGSVKEMSKKFIENAVETSKTERQSSYPKAGLILRTSSFKDTAISGTGSSRESSPEKQSSITTTTVKKTTSSSSSGGRTDTFLNNKTRVRGVQDVITRMKNADDDVQAGDSPEDAEARTLLNKFIGSQVILSGMETRTSSSSSPSASSTVRRTTTTTSTTSKGGGKPTVITRTFTHPITEDDLRTVWDEQTLKLLLERSTDYEERQNIRGRIRDVMAEQEVCADIVAKSKEESSGRIEEKVETSKRTFTEGPVTTTQVTTKATSQQVTKKPMSPFAKFRQLDKQNSLNTPPGSPRTPTGSRPLFKFTDPEVGRQVTTVKDRLLQWCQMKTKEYENVQLDNFSSSWADGLAFCALIHHFLPDAFDYHALTPKERRHNFTLAFRVADEKADIVPLLDVDDMVATRKPDWKCVFTYVQTIYSRFRNED